MRGFVTMALTLIALQVVLTTPLNNVIGAAALPAQWAEKWMDPTVPLISRPVPAGSSSTATAAPVPAAVTMQAFNPHLPPPAATTDVLAHVQTA